jgi:hypothetical protein
MIRDRRFLLGAVLIPTLTGAQQPLRLLRPDATFPEPFTQITSVRELRDGRVVALDRRDGIVLLVDFRNGKATAVGREGSGPANTYSPADSSPSPGTPPRSTMDLRGASSSWVRMEGGRGLPHGRRDRSRSATWRRSEVE